MHHGYCAACGATDVHQGEMAGPRLGPRPSGGYLTRWVEFGALVCASCGHLQL